jgi:hypothetical protein
MIVDFTQFDARAAAAAAPAGRVGVEAVGVMASACVHEQCHDAGDAGGRS